MSLFRLLYYWKKYNMIYIIYPFVLLSSLYMILLITNSDMNFSTLCGGEFDYHYFNCTYSENTKHKVGGRKLSLLKYMNWNLK